MSAMFSSSTTVYVSEDDSAVVRHDLIGHQFVSVSCGRSHADAHSLTLRCPDGPGSLARVLRSWADRLDGLPPYVTPGFASPSEGEKS